MEGYYVVQLLMPKEQAISVEKGRNSRVTFLSPNKTIKLVYHCQQVGFLFFGWIIWEEKVKCLNNL